MDHPSTAVLSALRPRAGADSTTENHVDVDNWKSILTLIVFLLANVLVIAPFRIPLPRFLSKPLYHVFRRKLLNDSQFDTNKRLHFPVNFVSAPVFGVFFLWATQCIGGQIVRNGIVGTGGIKPLDIMALFISLAYIAIALDATGLLRFLAFWVVRKGGSSGPRLYLFLYLFFFGFGVLVGNDPIILSGTAFLAYLTRVAGIVPPTAWIYAQFCSCNIASAVLVSSNPTNLVVAGGFSISFLVFTANLVLPVVASAAAVYPVLRWGLFRSTTLIPPSISASGLDPKAALVDSHGAIFGSALMVTTLMVLVGTSAGGLHVEVWMITVPAAIIMFIRDVLHDINAHRRKSEQKSKSQPPSPTEKHRSGDPIAPEVGETPRECDTIELNAFPSGALNRKPTNGSVTTLSPRPPATERLPLPLRLSKRFPTPITTLRRLPYPLLPFAFSMFILVQGLASTGWIAVFARWWAAWARVSGLLGVVGGMGFVSVCLCNLCGTNIGATILLARVIQNWESVYQPSARDRHGAIYALAIGSNYGAFSTIYIRPPAE
ncbi:citrate transporter [Ceratobasidium sp. AG-Ba]|nr:citrate transporter [Ceratobasidium sp. AG-Ba]